MSGVEKGRAKEREREIERDREGEEGHYQFYPNAFPLGVLSNLSGLRTYFDIRKTFLEHPHPQYKPPAPPSLIREHWKPKLIGHHIREFHTLFIYLNSLHTDAHTNRYSVHSSMLFLYYISEFYYMIYFLIITRVKKLIMCQNKGAEDLKRKIKRDVNRDTGWAYV